MSLFPKDDKQRKMLPMLKMITGYFPKALREVTRVCVANNVRYNPDRKPQDINWARGKSADQFGSLFRHIVEAEEGLVYEELPPEVRAACGEGFEKVYVLAEAAWRALAALELQIEAEEAKVPFQALLTEARLVVGNGKHYHEARDTLVAVPVGTGLCWGSNQPPPTQECVCLPCETARDNAATGV